MSSIGVSAAAVVGFGVAVRGGALVQELHAAAGDQDDLGREAVGVLAVLLPAPGLELARDVDQAALPGVLLEHIDQARLESHDAVPFRPVDPVARVFVNSIQMQAVTPKRVIFSML